MLVNLTGFRYLLVNSTKYCDVKQTKFLRDILLQWFATKVQLYFAQNVDVLIMVLTLINNREKIY